MTAPNNNYAVGIAAFTENNYYEAPNVGYFNSVDDIIASCTFWLEGAYQAIGAVDATRHFLIGNADDANNTGWSLRIARASDFSLGGSDRDPILVATIGDGSTILVSAFTLSGAPAGGSGQVGYISRLIHASLYYDRGADTLSIGCNGTIIEADVSGGDPYADSALALRMGRDPANAVTANAASGAVIVGAGFSKGGLLSGNSPGPFESSGFVSARGANWQGFISDPSSLDFMNRWEANSVPTQGSIVQAAGGSVSVAGSVSAPASLPDRGSAGITNVGALIGNDTPLAENGSLNLIQMKNPDWYMGPGFRFQGAGE